MTASEPTSATSASNAASTTSTTSTSNAASTNGVTSANSAINTNGTTNPASSATPTAAASSASSATNLIHTKSLTNNKVYIPASNKRDADAVKKLGRLHHWVFHPRDPKVVGFLVKRPDVAWMFHRQDSFIAVNGFSIIDGTIVVHEDSTASGKGACKALGISLDACVLWIGLPVMCTDGTVFGVVGDVAFDANTGVIEQIEVHNGATANALLGKLVIPKDKLVGFRRGLGTQLSGGSVGELDEEDLDPQMLGAVVVDPSVKDVKVQGGVAEKAGATTAVVTDKAKKAVSAAKPKVQQAGKVAGAAAEKGVYAAGKQIGRTSGMFTKFKDNFKDAMK